MASGGCQFGNLAAAVSLTAGGLAVCQFDYQHVLFQMNYFVFVS